MKRFIAMLLAVLICITAVPLTAVAEAVAPVYDVSMGDEESIFGSDDIVELYATPITITENMGGYWNFYDPDEDGEGEWWYYYDDIYPEEVTVVYGDGSTKTCAPDDDDEISWRLRCRYEQSYENQLHLGENTVEIFLGAAAAEYFVYGEMTVILEDGPIESISVEPINFWEHSGGEWEDWYDWENDITYEDAYYHYDLDEYDIYFTVEYKDGSSYEGSLGDYRDMYGWESVYFDDEQRMERSFDVGSYERMFSVDGFKAYVPITVHESPVKSVSVSPVEIWKDTNGGYWSEYDHETGETIENAWFEYNVHPQYMTVEFKNGEIYEGEFYPFFWKYNEELDFGCTSKIFDDQSYENPWGVGSHTATIELMGAVCEFTVEIVDSPIVDIEVDDIYCIENWDGDWTWKYNSETGEFYGKYWRYDYEPETITVHFRDGSSITGEPYEIQEMTGLSVRVSTYQDYDYQYELGGVYECTVNVGTFEKPYNVYIIESPIESFIAHDAELYYELDGNWSGYFDPETDEFFPKYFAYDLDATFDIALKDGRRYKDLTNEDLKDMFGDEVKWEGDPRNTEETWGLGEQEATAYFLGASSTATFNIIEPLGNLYVPEFQVIENWDGWIDTEEGGEEFWCYDTWPEYVVVTLNNGEVYSGTTNEIEEAIGGTFAMSRTQWPGHTWDECGVYECRLEYWYEQGKFFETTYKVEVVESPVESITFPELTYSVNKGGWYSPDYDDETDEYLGRYYRYDITPDYFTITMKDGRVYEDVTDEDVFQIFGRYIDINDDQGYYNQWGVGEHTAHGNFMGYEFDIPVTITESNISYIRLAEEVEIKECSYEYCYLYSTEGYYDKWLHYELGAFVYEVGFSDGTSVIGNESTLYWHYDIDLEIDDDQSYENQWGVGTHTFEVSCEGKTEEIEIEIVDNGISHIEVEDISFYEGENQIYHESEYGDWYEYDLEPEIITVYFDDGTSVTDDYSYLMYMVGVRFIWESDQSKENQWGVGEHTAYVRLGSETYPYTVSINEFSIERIEVEDVEVIENWDGWYEGHYDWETDTYIPESWFRYDFAPETVTLYYKDGISETITFDELIRRYTWENISHYIGDQSYENQWVLGGSYTCTLYLFGLSADYEATVVETPVANIEVQHYEIIEKWHGGWSYQYTEDGEFEWFSYDIPMGDEDRITVTMNDGRVITGNYDEIYEELGAPFNISVIQSWDDPCTVGTNFAKIRLLGYEKEFEFTLVENPVASIELEKAPDKTVCSDIETFDMRGAVIKVNYKDGTSESYEFTEYCYDGIRFYSEKMGGEFYFNTNIEPNGDKFTVTLSEISLRYAVTFDIEIAKMLEDIEVYTGEDGFGYCKYIFTDGTEKTVKIDKVHFEHVFIEETAVDGMFAIIEDDGAYMLMFDILSDGSAVFGAYESSAGELIEVEMEEVPQWLMYLVASYSFVENSVVIDEAIGALNGFNGKVSVNNIDELILSAYYLGCSYYYVTEDFYRNGGKFVISEDEAKLLIYSLTGQMVDVSISRGYDELNGEIVITTAYEGMVMYYSHTVVADIAHSGTNWNFKLDYTIFDGAEERCTMNIIIGEDGYVKKYFEGAAQPGDLTGDGSINITDLFSMKTCLAMGTENSGADINGDGTVNITDLFMLKQILVG